MKNLFALCMFLPLYLWGQNVVFNPGFDMTPWDTGWTIETDTFTTYSGSGYALVIAEVKPNTGSSLPNCCYLMTDVGMYPGGGFGAGTVRGEAKVWQTFNEITNCIVKVMVKYYWKMIKTPSWENKAELQVRVNNVWNTIWDAVADPNYSQGGDTVWSEVDTIVNGSVTGIRFYVISYLAHSSFTGARYAEFYFWVDDICIEEVGIEEKEFEVKSVELRVWPNPFVQYAEVRGQRSDARVEVYDMGGNLVKETKGNIIGKNLPTGIYFIKVKGYKPVKVIKMGGTR